MPQTISPTNAISLPGEGLPSAYRKPLDVDPAVAVDPPVTGGPGPLPESVSKGSEKGSRTVSASGSEGGFGPIAVLGVLIGGAGLYYYFAIRRQVRLFSGK